MFLKSWHIGIIFPDKIRIENHINTTTIYSTPPHEQNVTEDHFYRSFRGLDSEYNFLTGCYTKVGEPSLQYDLPLAGRKIIFSQNIS